MGNSFVRHNGGVLVRVLDSDFLLSCNNSWYVVNMREYLAIWYQPKGEMILCGCGCSGLREGDDHPAYAVHRSMAFFYYTGS